jgi:hypothetical protein
MTILQILWYIFVFIIFLITTFVIVIIFMTPIALFLMSLEDFANSCKK